MFRLSVPGHFITRCIEHTSRDVSLFAWTTQSPRLVWLKSDARTQNLRSLSWVSSLSRQLQPYPNQNIGSSTELLPEFSSTDDSNWFFEISREALAGSRCRFLGQADLHHWCCGHFLPYNPSNFCVFSKLLIFYALQHSLKPPVRRSPDGYLGRHIHLFHSWLACSACDGCPAASNPPKANGCT